MKFSYNWLKELAKFKESPEKLAEFLALRVFEVESVVKKGRDWAMDVKLLPNRAADASGHIGVAKEIAVLKKSEIRNPKSETNPKFKIQNSKLAEVKREASEALRVKIENPDDCPRYTARVMNGVKVGLSPKWMRERLEVCGIQSINNVVDAANYVMLELGQPLHIFDYDRLKTLNPKPEILNKSKIQSPKPKTIIVRRAKMGEKLLALDEKTYPLSPGVLVIADEKEPIAIAGVKGGKESGVGAKTRNIILESANFDPARTRIASRLLNLKTDASYRFERGMDPNQTAAAIDRLAELIQKVAGGEILAGRVDVYPRQLRPAKILLRLDYANSLIGENIAPAFYKSCFRRLGWPYQAKLGTRASLAWYVEPPTQRRDIQIEEDIIEEIARLLGYEKIRAKAPKTHLAPALPNEEHQWENKIKDMLVAAGWTEAYAYAFVAEKTLANFSASAQELLELENPTSPETRYLGAHPAQKYLEIAAENLRRHDALAIFGLAPGFRRLAKPSSKTPADEKKYLVMVKAAKDAKGTKGTKATTDGATTFYEAKGTLDHLLESLGIADYWYDDALTKNERQKTRALHPYRTAKIMAGDDFLGIAAELHPAVQEKLKSKARLVFAEILFEKLWKLARAEAEFKPISRFPAVIRDIAVIVPENEKADDVEGVIQNAGGKLLADVDLFDYFQDEAMQESGQKSVAFRLVFQSPERTLTDGEVNRLCQKILRAVKQKEWEVRG